MEWWQWLLVAWLCGLTGACLFFYGAFRNQRRNFCADCGGWLYTCNCRGFDEVTIRIDKALEDAFREVDEHADNNPRH